MMWKRWLGLVAVLMTVRAAEADSMASVRFKIVDEEGHPVPGARVGIGFEHHFDAHNRTWREGVSDKEGLSRAVCRTSGDVVGGADKTGYYKSWGVQVPFAGEKFGLWQPWDQLVTVTLVRVEHPVPMYAKNVKTKLPVLDKPAGYDLMMGDWVKPYGKGEQPDLFFEMTRRLLDDRHYEATMRITFAHPGDGCVEVAGHAQSTYCTPKQAPAEGYEPVWTNSRSYLPGKGVINSQAGVTTTTVLRLRSERDAQGKVVRAIYGILCHPVSFDPRGYQTGYLAFTYFLNPDGTRNLEYDPARNLLPLRRDSLEYPKLP